MGNSIVELLFSLIKDICVIVVVAYIVTRTKSFNNILSRQPTFADRLILILVFGGFSIYGTYSGVSIFGAIANTRDLGPMIAGLVGGPIIGLGAGLIGGIHRYFLGGFTRIPCSLSTIISGLLGSLIYIFKKGKFAGVFWAVLLGISIELFHQLLTLLIAKPFTDALQLVKEVALPMFVANSIGIGIFALIIANLIKEKKTGSERDKYHAELEIAHRLQVSLLPDKPPQIKGYQIAAMSQPAREVGGDFYDFIDVAESKIGFVIADVAGKGLPAALFMALSRSFLRAQTIGNLKANTVLEKANKLIAKDAKGGMFVTAFYAILDIPDKILKFSNAGHNPPLFFHSSTGECEELRMEGIALGVFEEARFHEKEIAFKRGDIIVFYTDGVVEAIDKTERQFGMRKLTELLKDKHHLRAAELIKIIKEEVKEFSGNQPQFDDFTLMVVKVA